MRSTYETAPAESSVRSYAGPDVAARVRIVPLEVTLRMPVRPAVTTVPASVARGDVTWPFTAVSSRWVPVAASAVPMKVFVPSNLERVTVPDAPHPGLKYASEYPRPSDRTEPSEVSTMAAQAPSLKAFSSLVNSRGPNTTAT
ncbi:hypothetical protein [Curtobacterium sp. MMLR14_010]|uniref:hypothetical protein n=1 Tax=Curtobacterium sp. MMLR14_010 TaxID=1898743 RepID=UPI0011142ECE|nr:hypothetical protein [Curtobacterium sp. MMLR14_010]